MTVTLDISRNWVKFTHQFGVNQRLDRNTTCSRSTFGELARLGGKARARKLTSELRREMHAAAPAQCAKRSGSA
jgi:hypothetical protein